MTRLLRGYGLRLGTRIGVLLAAGVAITAAVSFVFFLIEHASGRPPISPGAALLARHIVSLTRQFDALAPQARAAAVAAARTPLLDIRWPAPPPGEPSDRPDMHELEHLLRAELGDPRRHVVVQRIDDPSDQDRIPDARIEVALRLADASWIAFVTADWFPSPPPLRLAFLLPRVILFSAVTTILLLWIAHGFTKPIVRLAAAAERLGAEGSVPPLVETGAAEVRAATRAFNQMQQRLSALIDDRTQMLAAISHDLRTPLTRLRLRAEFVDDPQLQEKMLSDLAEMEAMVASTLAFARNGEPAEARERLDLAALLQSLSGDMADCGHAVSYEGPAHVPVMARPVALRRALANLVDNAVKYGNGARLRLAQAGGAAQLTIDDDGPGIPAAEQERVFAPYYRVEASRNRETGGSGLGLSIARAALRAEGGEVAIANRPEGGLRVSVTLPLPA